MRYPKGSGGFSLIEILVATTILLVIVILASLVFQQTTGAYDTGERKVGANVALRNIVGAISRDLALAVDSDEYEGLPPNSWGGTRISFAALTGSPGYDAKGQETKDCGTLQVITYTAGQNVHRKAQSYKCDAANNKWTKCGDASESDVYQADSFQDASVDVRFSSTDDDNLPECVYIRAELDTSSETAAVGAMSRGRRPDSDEDDIWVGYKP